MSKSKSTKPILVTIERPKKADKKAYKQFRDSRKAARGKQWSMM